MRIIRAAKELGIKTVAVFSEADRDALFVRYADQAICIGPAPASESYLYYQNISRPRRVDRADAIHPGYGFLSENALFAEACRVLNINFIGPHPLAIRKMGDKSLPSKSCRKPASRSCPDPKASLASLAEAEALADRIGYPVIVKASAGGGGRGMRIVYREKGTGKCLSIPPPTRPSRLSAIAEIYLEKFIADPKHIEIQILGDKHGNVVHSVRTGLLDPAPPSEIA